jgi:hypothetical protein
MVAGEQMFMSLILVFTHNCYDFNVINPPSLLYIVLHSVSDFDTYMAWMQ